MRSNAPSRPLMREPLPSEHAGDTPAQIDPALAPVLRDLGKTLMQYNKEGSDAAEKLAQQAAQEPPPAPIPSEQAFAEQQADRRRDESKKRPRL